MIKTNYRATPSGPRPYETTYIFKEKEPGEEDLNRDHLWDIDERTGKSIGIASTNEGKATGEIVANTTLHFNGDFEGEFNGTNTIPPELAKGKLNITGDVKFGTVELEESEDPKDKPKLVFKETDSDFTHIETKGKFSIKQVFEEHVVKFTTDGAPESPPVEKPKEGEEPKKAPKPEPQQSVVFTVKHSDLPESLQGQRFFKVKVEVEGEVDEEDYFQVELNRYFTPTNLDLRGVSLLSFVHLFKEKVNVTLTITA